MSASSTPPLNITPASSLGGQFLQVATAANTVGIVTIIDHPLPNGNPKAIIFVTPVWNPGDVGGTNHNHPIGVSYVSGHWRIFNEDSAPMQVREAFNVIIPTLGANVFVHTATSGNSTNDYTLIDNSLTNGHPDAMLLVTPNWDPGGVGGTYNNHNIGVMYILGKWGIINEDPTIQAIPAGAAFNVFVLPAGAGVFVQWATGSNISGDSTFINNALTNGNPNAIIFVTPSANHGNLYGTYSNHSIGVWYDGGAWAVFHQDGAVMDLNTAFNILVLVPSADIFVHTASASNSASDYTRIDNALTNEHPNAIVFTAPNWNPGGIGGTYDNHNIGVFYNSSQNQEGIFN